MKMIYHYAYVGLKGCEIGELIGLNSGTVSVGRKFLIKRLYLDIFNK